MGFTKQQALPRLLAALLAIALPFGLSLQPARAKEDKHAQILSILRQATETAKQIERPSLRIDLLCAIAIAYQDAGEATSARKMLEDVLHAADRIDDPFEKAAAVVQAVRATLEIKGREEAQKTLDRAVFRVVNTTPRDDSDSSDQSTVLAQYVTEQCRCGNPFSTMATLQQAIRAGERIKDPNTELLALDTCVEAALKVSLREPARDALGRMRQVARSLDDGQKEQWLATVSIRMAQVGDYDAALGALKAIQGTYYVEDALGNIAWTIAHDKKNIINNIGKLINFIKSAGDSVHRSRLYGKVVESLSNSGEVALVPSGKILDELQELSRAKSLEGALTAAADIDWERARVLASVALARAISGDRKGAESNVQEVLRIINGLDNKSFNYNQIMTELTRAKARMDELDAALKLANSLNPDSIRLDAYLALAKELKQSGDLAAARNVLTTTFGLANRLALAANEHDRVGFELLLAGIAVLQAKTGDYLGARRTRAALATPPVYVTEAVAQSWTIAGHAVEAVQWASEQEGPHPKSAALLIVAIELLGRRREGLWNEPD